MVEFDELLITTGVDALVRLVKQKKRIELSDVSELLNIAEDTIEEWAGILEEQGILRIEYRLTKIYLVWISPSIEEIETEKKGFYKKRDQLKDEIEGIKIKAKEEKRELDEVMKTFSQLYSKISPKLKDLEKKIDAAQKAKEAGGEKFDVHLTKIDAANARIDEITKIVNESKGELSAISKKIEKGPTKKSITRLDTVSADLKKMKSELAALKRKATQYARGVPAKDEMPRLAEIKAKLNQIVKEYKTTRERSVKLRQDLIALEEGKDVLKTIGDSMKGYDKHITSMKKEISLLSKQAGDLKEKSDKINAKVEKDKDTLERFSDSMNVAKGIMSRFPSGKNISAELEKMKKSEAEIDERTKALKKLLEIASGARVAAVEFETLSEQIDEKMDELSTEIDELSQSLEDEKRTFFAYQSIRERIAPSLTRHKNEIKALSEQLKAMQEDVKKQTDVLEQETKKLATRMKKEDVKEVMKLAAEVDERRHLLENIKSSIESLSSTSENIARRIAILSRQAGLIEIRSSPGTPTKVTEKEKEEIGAQIRLTRQEEEEFKRKREELRSLIKKLWEKDK
jgi:chromosome segregation ATPase